MDVRSHTNLDLTWGNRYVSFTHSSDAPTPTHSSLPDSLSPRIHHFTYNAGRRHTKCQSMSQQHCRRLENTQSHCAVIACVNLVVGLCCRRDGGRVGRPKIGHAIANRCKSLTELCDFNVGKNDVDHLVVGGPHGVCRRANDFQFPVCGGVPYRAPHSSLDSLGEITACPVETISPAESWLGETKKQQFAFDGQCYGVGQRQFASVDKVPKKLKFFSG